MGAKEIQDCADKLGITMESTFVPWSVSRRGAEEQPSLNWTVRILCNGKEILSTPYSAGCGHAPAYEKGGHRITKSVKQECEVGRAWLRSVGGHSKPILPSLPDVLASLALDSEVIDHPDFESWASDLGYDADSRSAEATYRACLDIALKLRSGLGESGLAELREACQDY